MDSKQVRQKYLDFFKGKGHVEIAASKLVLENDPTTLFISAGMQPIIPYLKGEKHPDGTRLVNSQPCFRSQDIEEVGDNRHTTFFEMLGNWSLGDYFKKEQLTWVWEFLTEELTLSKDSLHISIFEGNDQVPVDNESLTIWQEMGVKDDHIHKYPAKKNWWSLSGPPELMKEGEIGGPDSEVFYDFGTDYNFHENSVWKEDKCHPNCDCGRFMEIGNSVFIQFGKSGSKLEELPQKNVDFGGGLERLLAATANEPDMFKSDLLWPIVEALQEATGADYQSPEQKIAIRIIVDHIKAAAFLIMADIVPANKLQGYILRRLLRRATVKMRYLTGELKDTVAFEKTIEAVLIIYKKQDQLDLVKQVVGEEVSKFLKTLEKGLKEVEKIDQIDGKKAFDLYQTYGLPVEISAELFEIKGQKIDMQAFTTEFDKHKELSRTASAGMFKGGLASHGEQETKYHTATHLLHQALRQILGDHVIQRGSNITAERMRFDFSHSVKLTDEQIAAVAKVVNEQIEKNLTVSFEEMDKDQAMKSGAIGAFGEKYGDKVKVYSIGDFSKEICGGPHVEHTNTLGKFEITKEESASSGIRRIYATLS